MPELDVSIFYFFYDFASRSQLGDSVIIFLGDYAIFVAFAIFLVFGFKNFLKTGKSVLPFYLVSMGSSILAEGFSVILKMLIERPRPFITLDIPHLLSDSSYAFPSGHTTFLFALATATYYYHKKLGVFLFGAGIAVGLSRVAGGVHYPFDILGGAVLGMFVGVFSYRIGMPLVLKWKYWGLLRTDR